MTIADTLQAAKGIRNVLLNMLAKSGAGDNISLVQFSAHFVNQYGQEVEITDRLHLVNNVFHMDAVYQVECYLITVLKAERFIKETLVKTHVSSRHVKNPTT